MIQYDSYHRLLISGGDIMFYDFIKAKLEAGEIKVRPSARGTGGKVDIKARGITAIAVWFLSRKEKQQIMDLSKYVAMRRRKVRYGDPDF
jgi:hypothetical protein